MLIVDASVAVKFVFHEPGSEEASALLAEGHDLVAPDWLLPEVASALWNKVKHSELLEVHAEHSLAAIPEFFGRLFASVDLIAEAFRLSFRLRHPVYDCIYLALAVREQAPLVTADKKFHRAVERYGLDGGRLLEWPA